MLIKKTIVILDETKTIGHLSIIRVGQETGAKLSLVKAMNGFLLIKLSGSEQECFEINTTRMEFMLKGSLNSTDRIGVLIANENGEIQARGGEAYLVKPTQVAELKKDKTAELEEPVSETKESIESTEAQQPKEENEETEQEFIVEVEEEKVEESVAQPDAPATPETEPKAESEENDKKTEGAIPFNFIKGENFYRNVKAKLAEIMTANPRDDRLEGIIPDSKWVKVYYDKDEYYVVGILTDEGDVKFLAYGVPGVKDVKPPKDAEELCDFLEIKGGLGEGYWIMFQNAKNGEIVKSIE